MNGLNYRIFEISAKDVFFIRFGLIIQIFFHNFKRKFWFIVSDIKKGQFIWIVLRGIHWLEIVSNKSIF